MAVLRVQDVFGGELGDNQETDLHQGSLGTVHALLDQLEGLADDLRPLSLVQSVSVLKHQLVDENQRSQILLPEQVLQSLVDALRLELRVTLQLLYELMVSLGE